jgi:hypothetical protein
VYSDRGPPYFGPRSHGSLPSTVPLHPASDPGTNCPRPLLQDPNWSLVDDSSTAAAAEGHPRFFFTRPISLDHWLD